MIEAFLMTTSSRTAFQLVVAVQFDTVLQYSKVSRAL